MTAKEMCEYIVDTHKKHGIDLRRTAEEIWNMSPTSDLYHVYDLYYNAKVLDGWHSEIDTSTGNIMWHKEGDLPKEHFSPILES